MSDGLQQPELEIKVAAHGREVAVVAFFTDEAGSVTCLVGLEEAGYVSLVAETLLEASRAITECKFRPEDFSPADFVSGVGDGNDAFPF